VASSATAQQVVKDTVALAAEVGRQTIAEGGEDEPTLVVLGTLGVDFARGFHVGRPAATVNRVAARPL
jgi:EAL domain-containing protein (putative c-di-GMP-specific phosphodiesterase class I)